MKDHEVRELVNELTEAVYMCTGKDLLRERIAKVVKKHVPHASKNIQEYPLDKNGRCAHCHGWGCPVCCSSEAEIRARQGTFS